MLAEDVVARSQKVVFWNFKDSVRDVCVGIDGGLSKYFKEGTLENIADGTLQFLL